MIYSKINVMSAKTPKKEKPKFTTVAPKKKETVKKSRTKREEATE